MSVLKLFNFDKTVPYIRKKGIARYFQIVRLNFFDLVLLNFAFAVTCIPVFTIGAAYKALVGTLLKMTEDKGGGFVAEYFKAFGSKFLSSTLYSGLFSLLFTIIAFASSFYYNLAKQNVIFYVAAALCFSALITVFMMTAWFFPLFVKTNDGFFALVKKAFVLTFASLKESFFYLLTALICAFVIWAFLPYSTPLIFVFPFSFTALSSACFTNNKITEIYNLK